MSQFRQPALQCSTIFLEAKYSIFLRESSLTKEGLFFVIFLNCLFSPSMMFVVYMIFLIAAGYAKKVDSLLEHITIHSADDVQFTFKNGSEINVKSE